MFGFFSGDEPNTQLVILKFEIEKRVTTMLIKSLFQDVICLLPIGSKFD